MFCRSGFWRIVFELPFTKQNFALWRQLKLVKIIFHCIPIGEKIDFCFHFFPQHETFLKSQGPIYLNTGSYPTRSIQWLFLFIYPFVLLRVLLLFASIGIFWYYLHTCYKVVGTNMDIKLFSFSLDNLVIHTFQISKRFKVVNLNVFKKQLFLTIFSSKIS